MTVNICGIPHKVIECEDNFNVDVHFGQIDYKACEIRVNKNMSQESKDEALCHEMVHGIFVHLGYNDYANDEQLVQALGNAIYQGFEIKAENIEVLDKIQAEIEQNAYPIVHGVNNHELGMTLYGILQIIDKYKAESEDKE